MTSDLLRTAHEMIAEALESLHADLQGKTASPPANQP